MLLVVRNEMMRNKISHKKTMLKIITDKPEKNFCAANQEGYDIFYFPVEVISSVPCLPNKISNQ
jgi:hypothetical protein